MLVYFRLRDREIEERLRTECDDLVVVEIKNDEIDPLCAVLDPGKAPATSICESRNVSHTLIDEKKGRSVARDLYGLEVTGTARLT